MPFLLKYLASIKDLIFIDKAKIVKEMDDLGYCGRDLNDSFLTNFYISNINIELNFGIFNGNKNFSTEDNNNSKTFVQRLTIKKYKNFTFGINSSQKVDSISTNFFIGNGIDLSYTPWKNFTITSEILYGRKSSKSLIGGAYLGFDYKIKKFNLGLRYSKYYKNLELSGEDFVQSKIDWHLNKKFKLIFNYEVSHSTIQKFNSKLILAGTYEI